MIRKTTIQMMIEQVKRRCQQRQTLVSSPQVPMCVAREYMHEDKGRFLVVK